MLVILDIRGTINEVLLVLGAQGRRGQPGRHPRGSTNEFFIGWCV